MFNPYQTNNLGFFQPNVLPQPIMPQQQIVQVNGKASVDTMQLAPNSSLLAMDTTAPIVWMCVSDGIGKVSATPYDIVLHKEAPAPDIKSIEERLSEIENRMTEMEKKNDKSDASKFKPKPNYSDHSNN